MNEMELLVQGLPKSKEGSGKMQISTGKGENLGAAQYDRQRAMRPSQLLYNCDGLAVRLRLIQAEIRRNQSCESLNHWGLPVRAFR